MMPHHLAAEIARLTFLCSEIHHATRAPAERISTERLERTLAEAEGLCRALRHEIKRRADVEEA
jgi:hypothetical protein